MGIDRLILAFKESGINSGLKLSVDPSSSFLSNQTIQVGTEYIFILEDEAQSLVESLSQANKKLQIEKNELHEQLRNKDYEINLLKDKSTEAMAKLEKLAQMPEKLLTHGDEHYLRTTFCLKVKCLVDDFRKFLGGV